MYIRQEKPEDFDKIYELVREAFETVDVKEGDEQDYVKELRKPTAIFREARSSL